jgi:hypothetical protein
MKCMVYPLLLLLLTGCSYERKITRKINKSRNELQVRTIAKQIFEEYSNRGQNEFFLSRYDSLDKKYFPLLRKLRTPWVHIIYGPAQGFIDTDSVVLFTKTGLPILGYEHDILIDLKTMPRDSFDNCGNFTRIKKLKERIFYIKAEMPVPLF